MFGIILFIHFRYRTHPASEKNVIVKTHRDSIGWVLTKDRPFLESMLVHDDHLFMFNPDSEGTVSWKDMRWTGVIEKHNGKWKIVHTHWSFINGQRTRSLPKAD